jgi:hypothetical protein
VVELCDQAVFVCYRPPGAGPNVGGYLGGAFPGGHFKGLAYDQLIAPGTGRHDVVLDERATSNPGAEPADQSEWERLFGRFRYSLFGNGTGAFTAHDVLNAARGVIRQEAETGGRPG